MIYAIDSNVIVYASGVNDAARQDISNRLLLAVGIKNILVPLQALGETIQVLTKRLKLKKPEAVAAVAPWFRGLKTQETTREVFEQAMTLAAQHHFQVWDAIMLAAAKAGGASILFSEDMQNEFVWQGVTILNPYATQPNIIVKSLLSESTH